MRKRVPESSRGRFRKLGRALGVAIAIWFVVLLVLDAVYGRTIAAAVEERLAESLKGAAAIDSSDLALVRGHFDLSALSVKRDDAIGHLSLTVERVRCELPPLGIGVFDHGCRELALRGIRLEVSAAALFKLAVPKRAPVRTDRVVIDDAELVFLSNAIMPGIGRIAIHIDHAVSGGTTFHTPLAWLLTMEELQAHVDLPAGITVGLAYDHGFLSASGSFFGSQPVRVPLMFPSAHDAKEQIEALVKAGKEVAEDLVSKRAEDWIKSKL